jgi:hypothetical protein
MIPLFLDDETGKNFLSYIRVNMIFTQECQWWHEHTWLDVVKYRCPSIYASLAYAISLICEREILPSARYMRENFVVMRFCAVEHKVAGRSRTCYIPATMWQDETRGSCHGIQEEVSFNLAVGIVLCGSVLLCATDISLTILFIAPCFHLIGYYGFQTSCKCFYYWRSSQ